MFINVYIYFFSFHAEICIFLIAMVMFPARWICFLIITWFFLCHKDTIICEYFVIS